MAIDVAAIRTIKQTRNDFVFISMQRIHEIRHRKPDKVVGF